METIAAPLIGICLSAACGFRVFVPMLAASIASQYGYIHLSPGFEWIGTDLAKYAFATATVFEVLAYYIPWLDNCLDMLGAPIAVIAGSLLTASMIIGMPPVIKWSLAVVAGGGAAGLIHGGTALVRGGSTATTGGFGNFLVSTGELFSASTISIFAVVLPLLCLALIVVLLFYVAKKFVKRFRTA
jgi:hypothetical protein